MEPLECYTFNIEMPDNSIEFQIKTEPFQGDPTEECPIRTEKCQDKPMEDCPIKTEIVDEDLLPETPQEEDTLSGDPLEPTLRRQRLDSQAKLMILNVHKYFRKLRIIRAKETGEDMNVNLEVAQATGVSKSAVKKIVSDFLNKGIERAIRPPSKTRIMKRKTDIVVDEGEDAATINVKNKRKK